MDELSQEILSDQKMREEVFLDFENDHNSLKVVIVED
jgi:hypothetical protein